MQGELWVAGHNWRKEGALETTTEFQGSEFGRGITVATTGKVSKEKREVG